jgi:glycosyltransferase involved in cell wall biosynthesis
MQPKVSVVIYNYNQAHYVREAIESVINQTYKNIELIIVDNGSTDNSRQVLNEYKDRPNTRFIFNGKNERPTVSTIIGIAATTGELISILFADDYYLPEKIAKQVECFSKLDPDYGVVYSRGYRLNVQTGEKWLQPSFDESGNVLKKIFQKYDRGMIAPVSPLIRRECFQRYPYRPEIFTEADDIYYRFALGFKFYFIDEPLVVMRDHASNMGKAIKLNSQNFLDVMIHLEGHPELGSEEKKELRRYVARVFRNYAWQGFRVLQEKGWTVKCLKTATRYDWRSLFHFHSLAAVASLAIPSPFARKINRWITGIKANKEIVTWKESYS